MGDFQQIRNVGKKMARMGLYATKCQNLKTVKRSNIEYISDLRAKDGKELTDGCSIIDVRVKKHNCYIYILFVLFDCFVC